jgi:hypothetical protein
MSGRRGYSRCGVANVGGKLKVARDVAVWRDAEHELLVVSDEPGTTGEVLTLERVVHGTPITIEVSVIDSHPAVVNGTVRHRLRLRSNVHSDIGEPPGARTH